MAQDTIDNKVQDSNVAAALAEFDSLCEKAGLFLSGKEKGPNEQIQRVLVLDPFNNAQEEVRRQSELGKQYVTRVGDKFGLNVYGDGPHGAAGGVFAVYIGFSEKNPTEDLNPK